MPKLVLKTVIGNYDFNFKLKIIVNNNDFNFKNFKIVTTNYSFDNEILV